MATSVVAPLPAATDAPVVTTPAAPAAEPTTFKEALAMPVPATPEAVPGDPDAPVDPNAQQAAPAVDPNAVVEQPPQAPEDFDYSQDANADSVSQDGRRHFYSAAKSYRLQNSDKIVRSLHDVMPVVTPEAVRDRVEIANAADALFTMYEQGAQTPEAMDQVLDTFKARNAGSFAKMIVKGVAELPKVSPQDAQYVRDFFRRDAVNSLYSQARGMADGPEKDRVIALAQNADKQFFGTFIPKAQIGQQAASDPVKTAQAEAQKYKSELDKINQQQQQTAAEAWNGKVASSQTDAINQVIEESLGPVKTQFEKTPFWNQMQNDLMTAIGQAEMAHPEWGAQWQNLMNQANLSKSDNDLGAVVNYRRSVARMAARSNVKAIIDKYSPFVMASNQAENQRAATHPPNEPAPNGVAAPAPNGAIGKMAQAKNWQELFTAMR